MRSTAPWAMRVSLSALISWIENFREEDPLLMLMMRCLLAIGAYLLAASTGLGPPHLAPFPVADLWQIISIFGDVLFVLDQLVTNDSFGMGRESAELRPPVDHVRHQ